MTFIIKSIRAIMLNVSSETPQDSQLFLAEQGSTTAIPLFIDLNVSQLQTHTYPSLNTLPSFIISTQYTMPNSRQTVVLYPSIGMGHLIPMVELAKLFIASNFSVIITLIDSPLIPPINSTFISSVSSAYPLISFHHLPKLTPPNLSSQLFVAFFQLIRLSNPHLQDFLTSLSQTSTISALVLDMFCTYVLGIANDLNLKAYLFFTSPASCLTAFVLTPIIQSQTTSSFKDLGDAPQHFPGLPPIPASHMPLQLLDRSKEIYDEFSYHLKMFPKAAGIMINTFESLETRAVEALKDGQVFPGCPMPPIYCIGPLTNDRQSKEHECLTWLDAQPKGSVVFLCFGSLSEFCKEQLKEISIGLERSEQRFLWVVRSPPGDDPTKPLDEILPEGFLERTKGRGTVVKSWAPQIAILGHESVGGFVSHCGWNSTLEAVSAGVPMIAWPLCGEQKMNKVCLIEEAKLVVEMKGYDKEMVIAEEVETRIRWLMETEGGRELKKRAAKMKESALAARKEGGSSNAAWMELVRSLKAGLPTRILNSQ